MSNSTQFQHKSLLPLSPEVGGGGGGQSHCNRAFCLFFYLSLCPFVKLEKKNSSEEGHFLPQGLDHTSLRIFVNTSPGIKILPSF